MFLESLAESAFENCGLEQDETILIGVSGGADSLALLHGLNTLGFNLIVAHLDHALRPESNQDAEFVAHQAESMGLPFIQRRIQVQKVADQEGQSIEEAARQVRYDFLFDVADEKQVQAVVVAHNADDQVETVLMHFLRGAALPGLTGMPYRRIMPQWHGSIPLVRPLLGIWREEIETYLSSVGLSPRVDLTNKDTTYYRNRIRHELLPELDTFNPQIKPVIWRMADILQEEDCFIAGHAADAYRVCFDSRVGDRINLHRYNLQSLPKALQRRVLRKAISTLRPDLRDVGYDSIERAIEFIEEPPESGQMDLVARLDLVLLDNSLIIKDQAAELPDWGKPLLPGRAFKALLDIGGQVILRHGWRIESLLHAEKPPNWESKIRDSGENTAWLDFDRLQFPLKIRSREPGDRWKPLGMNGHTQSLQDFFINEKVPEHLRDIWPLVLSGDRIVWVAGLRPGEPFKVRDKTQRILQLSLVRE